MNGDACEKSMFYLSYPVCVMHPQHVFGSIRLARPDRTSNTLPASLRTLVALNSKPRARGFTICGAGLVRFTVLVPVGIGVRIPAAPFPSHFSTVNLTVYANIASFCCTRQSLMDILYHYIPFCFSAFSSIQSPKKRPPKWGPLASTA